MILVKDRKTTSQADTRRQRLAREFITLCGVMPGFPPTGIPSMLTEAEHGTPSQECAVSGHLDCRELAAALQGTNISSILGFIFLTVSGKGCDQVIGMRLLCTGAEQVWRGGENPLVCTYSKLFQ